MTDNKFHIKFINDAWYSEVPYSNYLWSKLQSTGWLYLPDKKLFTTKDDSLVESFKEYLLPEDMGIWRARLEKRKINYNLSFAKSADRILHPDLFDFQNVAAPEIIDRNILLADEMGLGKTVQAIMAINELKPDNVLIIVPNMLVMKWYDEIDKWMDSKDTLVYICPWSRLIKMDPNVFWDFIIVDEAHYAKNSGSKRSKAFSELKARHKMCLTGTPILGRPDEIFPIVNWLEPGLLGTFANFERKYMTRELKMVKTRYGYRWVTDKIKGKNIEELQKLLRETIMISRLKKDVLTQLPPKLRSVIALDVSVEVKRLDAKLITLWETATVAGNNDMKIWSNIFAIRKEAALLKLPMVNSFIDEVLEDEKLPLVVWAHHHEVIDGVVDHLKSTVHSKPLRIESLDGRINPTQREKIVHAFQAGEIDVLVAGLTAAGVGITLTTSDVAVFAELDWTPANMVQAEDRLHRIGQTSPVNIYYCVSPNSLDGRLARILRDKQHIIDHFTNDDLIEEL